MGEEKFGKVRWFQTETSVVLATVLKEKFKAEARSKNGEIGIDLRSIESEEVITIKFMFPPDSVMYTVEYSAYNEEDNVFIMFVNKAKTNDDYIRLEPDEIECELMPEKLTITPSYEGWEPNSLFDCWREKTPSRSDKMNIVSSSQLSGYKLKANYNEVIATLEYSERRHVQKN